MVNYMLNPLMFSFYSLNINILLSTIIPIHDLFVINIDYDPILMISAKLALNYQILKYSKFPCSLFLNFS